jgi:hypothetical protein
VSSIDLKKVHRAHYTAGDTPGLVDVPARPYLMIDGKGDPNTSDAYRQALEALYPLAYGLRRAIRDTTGIPYTVMPLEGLWWVEDMRRFDPDDKSDWQWTAMISQPDEVTAGLAAEVLPVVTQKKKLAAGHLARVQQFGDGRAAQILHLGPYSAEARAIERLHRFIDDEGLVFDGRHHEIYLTDPRRSTPAKNRTIIRQPVGSQSLP